jgi:arylsulfatase A-like enzyme
LSQQAEKIAMTWKRIISVVLVVSGLFGCFISCRPWDSNPNVLLIVVDTLRADHVGCYGYQRETTPSIDILAGDSLVFKQAISAAPWTAPSLASLMTSKNPAVMGYKQDAPKLDEEILTLAEIFKHNGYASKGIISHVFASSSFGFDRGFDSYDQENAKGHGHVSSPSISKKAVSFIEDLQGEKFFLFLHYFDPHHNYILHEEFNFYPDYDGPLYSGQSLIREIRKIARSLSTKDIEYLKALYDS